MRKIILIGGDLASGKSTYSKFLAKKFGLSLINKDTLKAILEYLYMENISPKKI